MASLSVILKINNEEFWTKILVFFSVTVLSVDTIYKIYFGISYQNRWECILYSSLPYWLFLIYEYFFELLLMVIVGIFITTVIERYFSRVRRFIPKNVVTAFFYASAIPACSCSVIPLINTMRGNIPFRAIITFVVSAPLLNPYILVLSATMLGFKYTFIRFFCSFLLAVITGYVIEYFYYKGRHIQSNELPGCSVIGNCQAFQNTLYQKTYIIFKKIFPFMLLAAIFSVIIELWQPGDWLKNSLHNSYLLNTLIAIIVGIPVYFCNGADVLFLQPLVQQANLPLSAAIAFSLTSTSICITSLAMLIKFIGGRLTFIMLCCIVLITSILSFIVHFYGIL